MRKWNYQVILTSLKDDTQWIVLSETTVLEDAEAYRRSWRRLLGGKHWTVERRPGLDTLDHLALRIWRKEIK